CECFRDLRDSLADGRSLAALRMKIKLRAIKIGSVTIGGPEPAFILGPCVIESEEFVRRMGCKIAEICAAENTPFIFKASYDKANRSSVRSFRGIGAREGCEILASIRIALKIQGHTGVRSSDARMM